MTDGLSVESERWLSKLLACKYQKDSGCDLNSPNPQPRKDSVKASGNVTLTVLSYALGWVLSAMEGDPVAKKTDT